MKTLLAIACTAMVALAPVWAETTAQLTESSLASLQKVIAPTPEEQAWLQIPWETDLATARQKASEANKPIFLWEMDGHPLGCT